MERRARRKQARQGGRQPDESLGPITQAFESRLATPNCTLALPKCRVCLQLQAENDKLRDQLSFWDTYLVGGFAHPSQKV